MCTELFLAIIYFSTIFAVNFFLFKLLKTYTNNIIYLLKVQNIFKQKNPAVVKSFVLLHLYAKKNAKNINLLPLLNKSFKEQDILTLGNIYSFILKNNSLQSSEKEINSFYFELLENQYLAKAIDFENIAK
jgi:hypothetical protein